MEAIIVEDLHFSYKKRKVLENISFKVKKGEIFGIIGADGSGKSTLLHCIAGLLKPKRGKIEVLGKDVVKNPEGIRDNLSFLPQGLSLYENLSADENLQFFSDIYRLGDERDVLISELLRMSGLGEHKKRVVGKFSGGMKQKLALSTLFLKNPSIVVLDEPTTGIDPSKRMEIWHFISKLKSKNDITVVLSTAYLEEALRCTHILILEDGKIKLLGEVSEILKDFPFEKVSIKTEKERELKNLLEESGDFEFVQTFGSYLVAVGKPKVEDRVKALSRNYGIEIYHIKRENIDLSDMLIKKDRKLLLSFKDYPSFFEGYKDVCEINCVSKSFTEVKALSCVSFQVRRGEIFGLLGPNGAGKTTLIKILCGIIREDEGFVKIFGKTFKEFGDSLRKRIGYMSQKFSLYKDLTVYENMSLYGGIYGVPKRLLNERIKEISENFSISSYLKQMVKNLPVGIRQRVALSCALIHTPELLFLDEPTSGVDPTARMNFWDLISYLSRSFGVSVVVTTHYMDEAERCDRVAFMMDGRIMVIGEPKSIKEKMAKTFGKPFEFEFPNPFSIFQILEDKFENVSVYGKKIRIIEKDKNLILKRLREIERAYNISLPSQITEKELTLDEVFSLSSKLKENV